jgi:hypothetical protein
LAEQTTATLRDAEAQPVSATSLAESQTALDKRRWGEIDAAVARLQAGPCWAACGRKRCS